VIDKGGAALFSRRSNIASSCYSALYVLIVTSLASFLCVSNALAGQAILSWQAPTKSADGTPLTDLAGYIIHYGQSSGNYISSIDVGNQTVYTLTDLSEGQTYYFAVTAYDLIGNESDFSNEVSKTIPSASALLVASFNANPTTGIAPLNVTFSDTSSGPVSGWLWDFGDGANSSTQHPNHTYDAPGTYAVSLTVFDATPTSATLTLAWDASSDPAVDGYVLHYGTQSGAYSQQLDVGMQTTATLSDLVAGQSYFFAVTAYDQQNGNVSDFSNEVSTSLPPAGPSDMASSTITVLSSPPPTALAPAPPGGLRHTPF
jgi:PKD repeat protein